MSTAVCRQCGSARKPERGRCADCGAFIDAAAGAKAHRRDTLADALSFNWFDWSGELLGFALIGGIAADLIPTWTIIIALVLIVRPFFGLALRVAARLLDAP